MYKKIKQIHLVGIGGIGMSAMAELLVRQGFCVTGSDVKENETIRRLEKLGIRISLGHGAANIRGAELVVFSSAITSSNCELVACRENEIPLISRAEMLAELMRLKWGIAVAGAHGKTTTTSMIALIMVDAGLDPTFMVGGRMDNFEGTNARLGSGEFMVVEADESDGSFNRIAPSIAVVTNMDREHMDFYKNMDRLKEAFAAFLNRVPFYGVGIYCGDDPILVSMAPQFNRRRRTYGFGALNDYQITQYEPINGGSRVTFRNASLEESFCLKVPGRHNALNALASIAVADELSIPRKQSLESLEGYHGVQRRFQSRGKISGVFLVDDYAHHPREISATLSAAREMFPDAKVRVVFQPHRYTRTADLMDEFATSFKNCDAVGITEIYAAGESAIPGVSGKNLVQTIKKCSKTDSRFFSNPRDALDTWLKESRPGDVVLTLGAGDLPNVYKDLAGMS